MGMKALLTRCGSYLCGSNKAGVDSPRSTDNDWMEPPCEKVLRDLEETIDADAGLLILQGHKLHKYEERMAKLAKIYQRTAPLPTESLKYGEWRGGIRSQNSSSLEDAGLWNQPDRSPVGSQQHSYSTVTNRSIEGYASVQEVRPKVKRRFRRGVNDYVVPSAALFLQTQSVAGSSDFNDDEQQTPCEPRLSPCASGSDMDEPCGTGASHTVSSSGMETTTGTTTVLGSLDGEKPTGSVVANGSQEGVDEQDWEFSGTISTMSKGSAWLAQVRSYADKPIRGAEDTFKNALFTTTDIFATRDSLSTTIDEDIPTRLVSGKVESFMVFSGDAHTPTPMGTVPHTT